jgi:hypothetical protein
VPLHVAERERRDEVATALAVHACRFLA